MLAIIGISNVFDRRAVAPLECQSRIRNT